MINSIIQGNCKDIFPEIVKKYEIDLVLTDPPYNINFNKYDKYKDNLEDKEYVDLLKTFKGTPSVIIHYPEEMMKYVVPSLGVPVEVLAWCYNSNIGRKFRLVNIYGKKPNFKKVIQPYKNPNDKRIKERIKQGHKGSPLYDWFSDINIVKNVSKEKSGHPCPMPLKLIERLIILLTEENDLIVDPFMGSGTTALACERLNRRYIGIEMSKEYIDIANNRLKEFKEKYTIEGLE